ncbi:unnamed protein product [Owenia fusiformis]|uniref:Uncharacterized protein n=1 Tax=Owenia fusiformis TaxID=6347 RepID=A0A8J1TBX4_OWEFU|nr:unnamed protein product [Owenia fusiformis]
MSVESVLEKLVKDASSSKHAPIRVAASGAKGFLEDNKVVADTPSFELREKCLGPLKLAVESKNSKLALTALGGIQKMLHDERFHSSMESEKEEQWLPSQILDCVSSTPSLSEDIQIEVMKVLLDMTFSTTWCMNAKVITKISQVGIDSYVTSHSHGVRTAVTATMTQMLTAIAEKLTNEMSRVEDNTTAADDILADYSNQAVDVSSSEALSNDIVGILHFLCQKLAGIQCGLQPKHMEPLLLEGIHAVLANIPPTMQNNNNFIDLLWQQLCPTLISLLGNPTLDKGISSQKSGTQDEVGRGSGCSASAPSILGSSAKTIYNICIELVRHVGSIKSLRPVLESVYHRMLLYPPPQHRLDAIKAVKELLKDADRLVDFAGPCASSPGNGQTNSKRMQHADTALLKLIVDALQECCHCNDSVVVMTSVQCIDLLLSSVDQITQGVGLTDQMINEIQRQYLTSQQDIDGNPIGTETKQAETETEKKCNLNQKDNDEEEKDTDCQEHLDDDNDDSEEDNDDSASENDESTNEPEIPEKIKIVKRTLPKSESSIEKSECDDEKEKIDFTEKSEVLNWRLVYNTSDLGEKLERLNSEEFVKKLLKELPGWLAMDNVQEIDESIQNFASQFCQDVTESQESYSAASDDAPKLQIILNGDGVYVSTYSALQLNLKLIHSAYYTMEDKSLPITESQFLDGVYGGGLLLYIPPSWLSEIYRQVITINLLQEAGYSNTSIERNGALIKALADLDGLGSNQLGGQLMSDCVEELDMCDAPSSDEKDVVAGIELSKRILVACWDGIVDILSVLVNGKSSCGITSSLALMLGVEGAKEESLKAREAICTSLDGLQKAARLSCKLGLQARCGGIFAQLANASCVMEDQRTLSPMVERKGLNTERKGLNLANLPHHIANLSNLHNVSHLSNLPHLNLPNVPAILPNRTRVIRLHAAHVLSLDVVLSMGLEMGSHSAECWAHVFRCCGHIAELEHTYFRAENKQSEAKQNKVNHDQTPHEIMPTTDMDIDISDPELLSMPVMPNEALAPDVNVHNLITESAVEGGWDSALSGGGVLSKKQTSKVLMGLTQQVDRFFEDAADKLNLNSLVEFMTEMCCSSKQQLHKYSSKLELGMPGFVPTNALHLYRLGHIVLKCLRSGRPLLHLMKVWSAVAPHFIEASTHKDSNISHKAVACIHECITTLFGYHQELPHFNFNESLCKPFEKLLCLELCDGDTQDQIVCSICELVEACTTEIRSGWRPLFGALRAVKIEYTTNEEVNDARQRHIAAVLDVFDVFLNTDNVFVFAHAAVDCILCLLKYVKGQSEFEVSDSDSDSGSECGETVTSEALCLPALKYLEQCCTILASMWNMPACPVFNGANRIRASLTQLNCVDSVLPYMDLDEFKREYTAPPRFADPFQPNTDLDKFKQNFEQKLNPTPSQKHPVAQSIASKMTSGQGFTKYTTNNESPDTKHEPNHTADKSEMSSPRLDTKKTITLGDLDNHTGSLHVWYLILDGLTNTVANAPRHYQPQTLEMLFSMLRAAATTPGPDFSIHCANHLLLPMLQSWLRYGNTIKGYWDSMANNFKQCCGMCTDLVVEYVVQFTGTTSCETSMGDMLQNLYSVLIECIAQPIETISRLGCSCIRHAILSSGPILSEQMWYLTAEALQKAIDVSLYSVNQIMTLFHANSDNFYGDIGQVKVAVRKDCSGMECERLRVLAQQVFLLDSQRQGNPHDYELEEDISYVFLLYPPYQVGLPDPEQRMTRVPFKSLVIGLLSHQLLLQTIGSILLQGSPNMTPSERHLLPASLPSSPTHGEKAFEVDDMIGQQNKLPGLLSYLSCRTTLHFLNSLKASYKFSCDFDSRPGLKFLIQKVARTSVATNLYKQAGISMTFYIHTLLEVCSSIDSITVESVRELLKPNIIENDPDKVDKAGTLNDDVPKLGEGDGSSSEEDENGQGDARSRKFSIPVDKDLNEAEHSLETVHENHRAFLKLFKQGCDDLCLKYIDLLLDKEGTRSADQMLEQPLFFLIAQPEEITELKRDKSLGSMVAEKLKKQQDGATVVGMEAVQVQDADDPGSLDPQGDPESPQRYISKREEKQEQESRVYTVASGRTIKTLMSEYKRRKQQNSMPTFVKAQRSKVTQSESSMGMVRSTSADPQDREIEKQQQNSIMKDSVAHLKAWTEMICTILQLLYQLPEHQYQALLPAIFNSITQLVCQAEDTRLKEMLAHWVHKVGHLYQFAPHS